GQDQRGLRSHAEAPPEVPLRYRLHEVLDPQGRNEVARDGAVVGDESRAFDDDLRDEQPVERIAMVRRQTTDGLGVLELHVEALEATGFHRIGNAAIKAQLT